MKKLLIISIFISFAYLSFSQIQPTDGYVYVKANGTGNGSSWANATSDLQGAIEADGVSDVWIAEGTYYPTWHWDVADPRAYSFKMKNNVDILGGFPNTGDPVIADRDYMVHKVILSGDLGVIGDISDNAYHVIYNIESLELNEYSYINGVNINFGNANGLDGDNNRGGGVHNEGCSPKLYNCIIAHNYGERGAGMYNWESGPMLNACSIQYNEASDIGGGILNSVNSSPVIRYCYINTNNAVVYGGGIANVDNCNPIIYQCLIAANNSDGSAGGILNTEGSNPLIQSCELFNNKASEYGGGILNDDSSPIIVNCIIANGDATLAGGGILNTNGSTPSIVNSTIVYNSAGSVGGAIGNNSSSPNVTNCILFFNSSGVFNIGASIPLITYSCVQGGIAGEGNISDDPLLESDISPNFHLRPNSPAINAGINDSIPEGIEEDYFVNNRIINGTVDMGAYESEERIYVNLLATGNNNGVSWIDAFTSLESALDIAQEGHVIWVAAGTYTPSNNHGLGGGNTFNTFKLKDGVEILGGFVGNEYSDTDRDWETNLTILSGNLGTSQYALHVVTAVNQVGPNTIVDGFRIANGRALGGAGFAIGANVYINDADPTFNNCQIWSGMAIEKGGNLYANQSQSKFNNCSISGGYSQDLAGGAYVVDSDIDFTNCIFSTNESDNDGGALYVSGEGDINIYACSFSDNDAYGGNGAGLYASSGKILIISTYFEENRAGINGGAVFITGDATLNIINCTIQTNSADENGGNLYLNGTETVTVASSIIVHGDALLNPNIFFAGGSIVAFQSSNIEGSNGSGASWNTQIGQDNYGNIDENPMFQTWDSNLGLQSSSPCVNTGLSSYYQPGGFFEAYNLDFAGNMRISGPEIDMGALEIPFGLLKVNIEPQEAIDAGAQWSVDNGLTWNNSGVDFWSEPATYDVIFKDVVGYDSPLNENISIQWSEMMTLSAVYAEILLAEINELELVSAYPNPSSGLVFISMEENSQQTECYLFDSFGKLLTTKSVAESFEIDLSNYSVGLYLLKINNQTIKLIKR